MSHTPRLRQSLALILLGSAAILSGAWFSWDWWPGWVVGLVVGVYLYYLSYLEAAWISAESNAERVRVEIDRIRAVTACPNEKLNALSLAVPEIGLQWIDGAIIPTWEDTGVPLDVFREFLRGSNGEYVQPVREWAKDEQSQRQYEIIIQKLLELGYLKTQPRGPRSWTWAPNALEKLWARWMTWELVITGPTEMAQ
jgi:hypothetical protein